MLDLLSPEVIGAAAVALTASVIFWKVCAALATYEVSIRRRRPATRVEFPPRPTAYDQAPALTGDPRQQDVIS